MNRLKQEIRAAAADTINAGDSQAVTCSYVFSDNFSGFAGHFPGKPVLPAIVQLLTVLSLVEEQTGTSQQLMAVEDAKFLQPVLPGQELRVQYRQKTVKDKVMYDARLSVAGITVAAFSICLAGVKEAP